MPRYRHIFFDLDRTLWDFEGNSEEVLQDLYERYALRDRGIASFTAFRDNYRSINAAFWQAHREGTVGKDELRYERFHRTLVQLGVSDRMLSDALAEAYIRETPAKLRLIEGALELLGALAPSYELHLLTNGFADTQLRKVKGTGMEAYFREIITSDRAESRKPDPRIFHYALSLVESSPRESLMVGDNVEADIVGAKNVGMDVVLFDPSGEMEDGGATHRIRELMQLLHFLDEGIRKDEGERLS